MMQTAPHSAVHPFGPAAACGVPAAQPLVLVPSRRPRRVAPEQGKALEKLAHAIEYLADELTLECMTAGKDEFHPESILVAIEVLKRCNREIYMACPQQPTVGERVRSWLGRASNGDRRPLQH